MISFSAVVVLFVQKKKQHTCNNNTLTKLRCVASQAHMDKWLVSFPVDLVTVVHCNVLSDFRAENLEKGGVGFGVQNRELGNIALDSSIWNANGDSISVFRSGKNETRIEREFGGITR